MAQADRGRPTDPDEATPRTLLETVAGSPLRLRVLEALRKEAADKRDLADRTNVPRTTLKHNLDRLLEAGLVAETIRGAYRLTVLGRVTIRAIGAYRERVRIGLRLAPVLRSLPMRELDADITWFQDGDLTVATASRPHAPGERVLSVLAESSSVRGFLPTLPGIADGRVRSILGVERGPPETECRIDLAVPTDVAESLGDAIPAIEARSSSEVRLRIAEERLPFGALLRADARALLLGVDQDGKPKATLETVSADCADWIERRLNALETTAPGD